ncbi:MAG TPA: TrmH family RNA methyltransferase, partial [Solirubrobacteraceae bacterium]|nr:TrmH family RNA methyltransferase [Solirubrobacteraceae bacterium]
GGVSPRDLTRDARLLLGSEAQGLTDDERALCDGLVTIDAPGFESLNVAAAAAILTYELGRRN